jgi:hypothetical protein
MWHTVWQTFGQFLAEDGDELIMMSLGSEIKAGPESYSTIGMILALN